VKLVDAGDSKSPAARRAGSIPAPGTIDEATLAPVAFPENTAPSKKAPEGAFLC
jgi:hypothetical protein